MVRRRETAEGERDKERGEKDSKKAAVSGPSLVTLSVTTATRCLAVLRSASMADMVGLNLVRAALVLWVNGRGNGTC